MGTEENVSATMLLETSRSSGSRDCRLASSAVAASFPFYLDLVMGQDPTQALRWPYIFRGRL